MVRAKVIDLISVNPETAGVGTEPTETKRTVFCTVRSIGQQEAYLAMGQGLNPELKVILSQAFEYQGERLCEMEEQRYDIIRTYETDTNGIELTLQRAARNARPAPEPEPDPEPGPGTEAAPAAVPEGVG